jgi:hypothetical protein
VVGYAIFEMALFSYVRQIVSNQYALDLIERDLVIASVVEPSSTRIFVVSHLLGHLKPAAVAQVLRDPGSPEGVAPDLGSHLRPYA